MSIEQDLVSNIEYEYNKQIDNVCCKLLGVTVEEVKNMSDIEKNVFKNTFCRSLIFKRQSVPIMKTIINYIGEDMAEVSVDYDAEECVARVTTRWMVEEWIERLNALGKEIEDDK